MLDFHVPHTESPSLRQAGKDLLSLALMDSRNQTLRWTRALEAALGASLDVPAGRGLCPPRWELGHVGWFQERWIGRNVQRDRGADCDAGQPRLASILPDADRWYDPRCTPLDGRAALDLPDLQATRQYLFDTLETTLELLENARADDDAALYFYRLALFHEDARIDAFAVLAQALGVDPGLLAPLATPARREPLFFPATRWMLGSPPGGFAFGIERPAHAVAVPEFEIDAQAVSWGQFCEFAEDGGYDEARFWSPAGWAWAEREGRRTPRHVDQMRHGVLQRRFGRLVRVPLGQSVVHVSWFEADAWARWAGRRLPSEVEWEAAAGQGASRGFRWGDVLEWTAGTLRPYPGFVAGPDDDAAAAFGRDKVLRGASFATSGRLRSPMLRRFAPPETDALFCGFRSCAA